MKNQFKKKSMATVLILACMISGLWGCGPTGSENQRTEVKLLEPVGVAENYESVVRRNLYDAKVYAAYVCPKVTEYSFEMEGYQKFSKYGALPGEAVETGTTLVYGDTEDVDNRIKSLKEEMEEMKEKHEKTGKESGEILKNLKASGMASELEIKKLEESIKEEKELYELDYAYKQTQLSLLNDDLKNKTLSSKGTGVVMATKFVEEWREKRFLSGGDWVGGMDSLIAVGDTSQLELRCEFMSKTTVTKAKEVYAIINGTRYEVEYQAYESEEYQRLSEKNNKVYVSFKVKDLPADISPGTYASIVLVMDSRADVLSISKEAVSKEESGSYVYVYKDGESQYTPINTGFSDGNYIEITSGLQEGDKVLSDYSVIGGSKTSTLGKGKIDVPFSTKGYLTYPSFVLVSNPVVHGTCYLEECLVSQNQQVQKGEVLARVHVEADSAELKRVEKQLMREQSRLGDLKKAGEEANKFAIEMKQDLIKTLQEQISEMKKDYAVKEITSPISGIVIALDTSLKEGDLLSPNQAVFQVADESLSYIMVDDSNGQLNYGNEVEVAYKDAQGQSKVTKGMVVSLNHLTLSSDLQADKALIKVSAEALGDMAGSSQQSDGWWSRIYFEVKATLRSVDGVVLVPKSAVTEKDGRTYVKQKQADGSVIMQSFIAGGADNTNYWVADGLTEGMEICLE